MLPTREIHLDFHTSEKIPAVAADFDPVTFAQTAKAAHIDSMTVFARCHHGWLYYDSKHFPELVHPTLVDKNLLLEQVHALHAEGIKAPVYLTVQWDYHAATTHPEWLIRKQGGAHEGGSFDEPGFYQSLCVNTGYNDYLQAITTEVLQLLGPELDGLFFDIVNIRPCWCHACRHEMQAKGIDTTDQRAVQGFARFTMERFRNNMTALIRQYSSDCSIFYNAGHVGPALKHGEAAFTHFELESLPSGDWGYQHFPVTARYARTLGKDCMGMTGKFHTAWGDFHSLKNLAALQFECERMLSFGFACSIGDQLEPNGRLNPATYDRIGKVYAQIERYEPWARPAKAVVEAAVITSEDPLSEHVMPASVMGAVQLLEEIQLQFDVIDPEMALTPYRLIIIPDETVLDEAAQARVDQYVQAGGKVLACGRGGLNVDTERFPESFGVAYQGAQTVYPDFIVANGPLAEGLYADDEYVIYQPGVKLAATTAALLLSARAPYFKRSAKHFTSHLYTPSAKETPYPVAFAHDGVITFAHPLFSQYRQNAPQWCKLLVKNAVHQLLGAQLVTHDGPSTTTMQLLAQPEQHRVNLQILTYIPVRKSQTIDILEEATPVRELTVQLHLAEPIKQVRVVPEGPELSVVDGCFTVPECVGYAVVEIDLAD